MGIAWTKQSVKTQRKIRINQGIKAKKYVLKGGYIVENKFCQGYCTYDDLKSIIGNDDECVVCKDTLLNSTHLVGLLCEKVTTTKAIRGILCDKNSITKREDMTHLHMFHLHCILEWWKNIENCPICMTHIRDNITFEFIESKTHYIVHVKAKIDTIYNRYLHLTLHPSVNPNTFLPLDYERDDTLYKKHFEFTGVFTCDDIFSFTCNYNDIYLGPLPNAYSKFPSDDQSQIDQTYKFIVTSYAQIPRTTYTIVYMRRLHVMPSIIFEVRLAVRLINEHSYHIGILHSNDVIPDMNDDTVKYFDASDDFIKHNRTSTFTFSNEIINALKETENTILFNDDVWDKNVFHKYKVNPLGTNYSEIQSIENEESKIFTLDLTGNHVQIILNNKLYSESMKEKISNEQLKLAISGGKRTKTKKKSKEQKAHKKRAIK